MFFNYTEERGMSQSIVIGIVLIAVVVLGYAFLPSQNEESMMVDEVDHMMEGEAMMKEDGSMMEGEAMMEEDGSMVKGEDAMMKDKDSMMMEGDSMSSDFAGEVLAGSHSLLLDFNKEDYDKAVSSGKPVLVFMPDKQTDKYTKYERFVDGLQKKGYIRRVDPGLIPEEAVKIKEKKTGFAVPDDNERILNMMYRLF